MQYSSLGNCATHRFLESCYIPNIDFDAVQRLREQPSTHTGVCRRSSCGGGGRLELENFQQHPVDPLHRLRDLVGQGEVIFARCAHLPEKVDGTPESGHNVALGVI